MAKILMTLCLLLSASAFAAGPKGKTAAPKKDRKPNAEARVLTGAPAQKLFATIQDGQDADCGMGKCWVEARVVCEMPTNPKEASFTRCELSPLN